MVAINKKQNLLELSQKSNTGGTTDEVRSALYVYSISEVDNLIDNNSTLIQTVSGDLDTLELEVVANTSDISDLQTDVSNNSTLIQTVSGDLDTLFNTTTTTATSGAYLLPDGAEGFVTISVNGVSKKIPYYGV